MPQVTIGGKGSTVRLDGYNARLLDDVKRIFKDSSTNKPLSDSKPAVIRSLEITRKLFCDDSVKLLNEVRNILQEPDEKLDAKDTIIRALEIVKDNFYQENGADVRVGKKKVNAGNF